MEDAHRISELAAGEFGKRSTVKGSEVLCSAKRIDIGPLREEPIKEVKTLVAKSS